MKTSNITSKDNDKIKNIKKLAKKSWRDKTNQFVVENLVIIYDAMHAGFKPDSLFLTKEMQTQNNEKLRYILGNIEHCYIIDNQINKSFSCLATPSGITAVYSVLKNDKQEVNINLKNNILYLNAISDPGNVGTILRTALAFGINNIIVDEKCADIYNSKTINAAKDAIFKIKITNVKDLDLLKKIKNKMPVYATNIENGVDIENLSKSDLNNGFCLILGNEANGVANSIMEYADKLINIKTTKEIESLNVAVSSGIILHKLWNNK